MNLSTKHKLKAYYEGEIGDNATVLKSVKSRLKVFPYLKLISFLAAVCFIVAPFQWDGDKAICFTLAALSLMLFSLLYRWDEHYLQKKAYFLSLQSVYTDELDFLEGNYAPFGNGKQFTDKKHPYSYDLDVFGENSIFHMMNRTKTDVAAGILAEKLTSIPNSEQEILEKQQSLTELSGKADFRHRFMAICKGFDETKNNYALLSRYKGSNKILTSKVGLVLIYLSIVVTLSACLLAWLDYVPWSLPTLLCLLQLFFPMIFSKALNRVGAEVGFLHKNTKIHSLLLDMLHKEEFAAEINKALKNELFGKYNSKEALQQLSGLLKKFDQRHNAYILVLLNGFFLRDLFLLRQFYQWKDHYLVHVHSWISLLAEMEACVSQATYMFNRAEFIQPVMTQQAEVLIDAVGLGHPFIPEEKRVDNDVFISKKQFLIITGANMAGKSTFLRTLGANYILAINGMNVCASKFDFSLFHLFSSMRNTDDLSSGTSYFKAELERIRELIRYCRAHSHTLIILDELLKGTNSKDKLNGSVLFLKKMTEMSVTGIIATHDLELAKMEDEFPELFRNYCFEISLSEEERFSYKIQRGISKNLNATFLLQKILSEEL